MKARIMSGPGGFAGLGWNEGLQKCKQMGLTAAEIEFTYGVNMNNATAAEVGKLAKELGISLSVHGPYYINLASKEKKKIAASKKRILDSVERAHHMNAEFVVFHAAYYGDRSKEETYGLVKDAIEDLLAVMKKEGLTPRLAAETTGKPSAFGDLDELARLADETGIAVCVDFAHLKARNAGTVDLDAACRKIRRIKHKTAHFSGIEWTEKGERRHIDTSKAVIEELLGFIKKHDVAVRIINESPHPLDDAKLTMDIARRMSLA